MSMIRGARGDKDKPPLKRGKEGLTLSHERDVKGGIGSVPRLSGALLV